MLRDGETENGKSIPCMKAMAMRAAGETGSEGFDCSGIAVSIASPIQTLQMIIKPHHSFYSLTDYLLQASSSPG